MLDGREGWEFGKWWWRSSEFRNRDGLANDYCGGVQPRRHTKKKPAADNSQLVQAPLAYRHSKRPWAANSQQSGNCEPKAGPFSLATTLSKKPDTVVLWIAHVCVRLWSGNWKLTFEDWLELWTLKMWTKVEKKLEQLLNNWPNRVVIQQKVNRHVFVVEWLESAINQKWLWHAGWASPTEGLRGHFKHV